MLDFSQNFNRYSYCLNNPLRYTDPDGDLIRTVDIDGNFTTPNRLAQTTPAGQQAIMTTYTVSQYHSSMDFNTGGLPSLVINRYDASFFSGYGTSYQVINPSMSRYFNLFNWLWY